MAAQPLSPAPAAADESAGTSQQPKAGQPDPNKKICRFETPTGSIRPVRTCKTRAEFEEEANRAQANKAEMDTDRSRQQMISGSHG